MNQLIENPARAADAPGFSAERREALGRVLRSRHFEKAPLLSAFLSYVCEAAFDNDTARVTEQAIGVKVFRRPDGYDPGEDNIVRNYARQLRRRLELYYQNEGQLDAVRIEVPKGGYIAVFTCPAADQRIDIPNSSLETATAAYPELAVPDKAAIETTPGATHLASPVGARFPWSRLWLFAAYSVVLCGITAYAVHRLVKGPVLSPIHPLWVEMFRSDRDTVVIPADIGFVILQQLNNRTYSLAEYEGWPAVEQYDHVYTSFLKAQKYTSMLDLDTAVRLQRLPEVVLDRLFTRAARSLSMDDLSNDNAILLGSNFSNPWMEVFERSLNFHFMNRPQEGRSWILNTRPAPGESATYENTTRNITHETYAVIAFLPNLSKSGHVLIVEGLDGPGTQAAVDLLLQGDQLVPVLKKATRPDGTLGSFELLLDATSLDSRATGVHVVAERYYP
jgi:hypothetical protein